MRNDSNADQIRGFTKREVILMASKMQRRPVAESTFYRWLEINCITAKREYQDFEVRLLLETCKHFLKGGTRDEYLAKLTQETANAN